jgi:hypothetical protein
MGKMKRAAPEQVSLSGSLVSVKTVSAFTVSSASVCLQSISIEFIIMNFSRNESPINISLAYYAPSIIIIRYIFKALRWVIGKKEDERSSKLKNWARLSDENFKMYCSACAKNVISRKIWKCLLADQLQIFFGLDLARGKKKRRDE